jgi:serine/threonine protein kinase
MGELQAGFELAGYRIDSVAGRGGMGVVYRATDLALERTVALKLIAADLAEDGDFRARFKRESRIAASIRHPNVITVFRAGEEDGRLYIAMDYVEGTDLKAMIAEHGRLDPARAVEIVAQVAFALDAAHSKSLVHRDVKPANVLIAWEDGNPHAYLTDFGLTKATASESAMTKTGTFVGTLDYVAPEQIRGDRVDARADVYSLGCVLYHCLTGRLPYPRDSDVAKLYAHAHEQLPSARAAIPDLPAECDDVIQRAMAKDPADRFQSAGDLGRAALAAVAGGRPAEPERTVAVGEAAPTAVTRPTPAPLGNHSRHPRCNRHRRRRHRPHHGGQRRRQPAAHQGRVPRPGPRRRPPVPGPSR